MTTYEHRRHVWRLLDIIERVSFVRPIKLLRFVRPVVWLVALGCWLSGWRMDALLVFMVALILEVVLFRLALVRVLRRMEEE